MGSERRAAPVKLVKDEVVAVDCMLTQLATLREEAAPLQGNAEAVAPCMHATDTWLAFNGSVIDVLRKPRTFLEKHMVWEQQCQMVHKA